MSSPLTRPRFLDHNNIAVDATGSVSSLGRSGLGLGTLTGHVLPLNLSPSRARALTTLEHASFALRDSPTRSTTLQVRQGLVQYASADGQPRPRAGASVHKIVPDDVIISTGNAVKSPTAHGIISPSAIGSSLHGGVNVTTSPSKPGNSGNGGFMDKGQLAVNVSEHVFRSRQDSGGKRTDGVVFHKTASGHRAGGDAVASNGESKVNDNRRNTLWSPRTLAVAQLRSAKPQSSTLSRVPAQSWQRSPSGKRRMAKLSPTLVVRSTESAVESIGVGPPTNFKITADTLDSIARKSTPAKFGQRRPVEEAPCLIVLLWRRWKQARHAAKQAQRELNAILNNPVFLDGPAGHVVQLCGLTRENVHQLAMCFHLDFQLDMKGRVTCSSFLDWLSLQDTLFNRTLYKLTAKNLTLSGELRSFEDFIVATVTLCLFSQTDLLRFLFNAVDADESGGVNEEEYRAMIAMMATGEGSAFPGSFKKILEAIDTDHDGTIEFDEFEELGRKFPLALFPLFKYQIEFRMATLGQEQWLKVRDRVDAVLQAQNTIADAATDTTAVAK